MRSIKVLVCLLPGLLALSQDDALVEERLTREADPGVPAVIPKLGLFMVPAPDLAHEHHLEHLSYLAKNPSPPAPDHGQQTPHAHSYSLPPPILPSHQNPLLPPYPIHSDREPKSQSFNHPVALDTYPSSIKSKPNPVNTKDNSKSNSLTNVLSDIEAPVANIVLPTLITHVPDQTFNNQNANFTPNLPPVTNISPLDYQGPSLSSAVSYETPLPSTFLSDVQIPSTADTLYYESPVPNTFSVDNLAPSITPAISYETPDSFPNRFPIPAPGGPVPHPEGAAPIPVPAPHPAVPKVIPEYTPGKPAPVPTKAKCRIEEVEVEAEICTPTIKKDCSRTKLKTKVLVNKEECFNIVKTVCTEEEEEVDSEVCYYEYNMEDMEAEAKTAEVDYEIRCEDTSQNQCPRQQGYGQGHGYCKNIKTKVCYNEPKVSESRQSVTLGYPVPNKVCEDKQVLVPRVVCEEEEVEQCMELPYTEDEKTTLETCSAQIGKPECKITILTLPKQICEEIYEAPHPAPGYHAPAPAYNAPAPAYNAPAPAYNAPAPAYNAPQPPSYHAAGAFTSFSG